MKTIDNEEVTFESIDDHFYKFDSPEVVESDQEPNLATAFTLARPILVAMIATPLIPERWQAAIDTLVAGVHFPVDSAAGAVLGLTLGQYFVNRCTQVTTYDAYDFNGTAFPEPSGAQLPPNDGDFYWETLFDIATLTQTPTAYATLVGAQNGTLPAASNLILKWLWDQAVREWI